jgi:hypothetical protein
LHNYLLIGAGFSRNWGGWLADEAFEYLLGDQDVVQSPKLKGLLWKYQGQGGFEVALAELRQMAKRDPAEQPNMLALESAVLRMFAAMNSGYGSHAFEFSDSLLDRRPLQAFLGRFSAIFSLNQDLLLERHYLANKNNAYAFEGWTNWQLPGMQPVPSGEDPSVYPAALGLWRPSGSFDLGIEQPLFKIHGSSNWRTRDAKEMVILGGGKKDAISRYPVLEWYFREFSSMLCEAGARLMVIGYSFGDDHVNEVLCSAIRNELKLFVIDPNGSDVARARNATARAGLIYSKTPLERDLEKSLVGASRRSMREIFGSDAIERAKVMRFFER